MTEEDVARPYETMIVLRADLQEAGVKEQVERVRTLLAAQGATPGAVHEWGLRELAYEIEKQRRGYYVIVEYTAARAAVAELERQLKLSDVVLRFISVRHGRDAASLTTPDAAAPAADDDATTDEIDAGPDADGARE